MPLRAPAVCCSFREADLGAGPGDGMGLMVGFYYMPGSSHAPSSGISMKPLEISDGAPSTPLRNGETDSENKEAIFCLTPNLGSHQASASKAILMN